MGRAHPFGTPFSPVMGMAARRVPLRGLGYTPTGAATPTECTQYGTRMIQEQGGYTPIGCPLGPDCHDIIDAVTGQIVVAKVKGSVPWVSLCSQFGYSQGGASPPAGVQQQQGGCIEPSPDGSGGCRDVVPCPKGPAVSNNPDGAAAPGQGRRYTLVDYKTGELIKEDVGDEIWNQYSVTSLPDAWVCEDPRCKPYCGTPEPAPAPAPEPPAPEPAPAPPPPAPTPAPMPAPQPQPPITVIIPPPRPQPSPCDPGAWLRQYKMGGVQVRQVPLRRGMF